MANWQNISSLATAGGTLVLAVATFSAAFRRQGSDLYIPAGGTGYWESALRQSDQSMRPVVESALANREPFRIDLLSGDQQGVERTISRFTVVRAEDFWSGQAARHWNLTRPDPR